MRYVRWQRTGYVPGYGCFIDTCEKKWDLLVENSEGALIFSGPVAADFNSDATKDILIGIWANAYPVANLYRGEDGAIIWGASDSSGGPKYASPSLMDITGDGRPEVSLDTQTPNFKALNGSNGFEVWTNPNVTYGMYSGPLVIESPPTVVVGDNGTL